IERGAVFRLDKPAIAIVRPDEDMLSLQARDLASPESGLQGKAHNDRQLMAFRMLADRMDLFITHTPIPRIVHLQFSDLRHAMRQVDLAVVVGVAHESQQRCYFPVYAVW